MWVLGAHLDEGEGDGEWSDVAHTAGLGEFIRPSSVLRYLEDSHLKWD
jgi:hypothetical protein